MADAVSPEKERDPQEVLSQEQPTKDGLAQAEDNILNGERQPDEGTGEPEPTTDAETQVQEDETLVGEDGEPEDAFTKIDPNTVPKELRPFYRAMQGDYTRKTQRLAAALDEVKDMLSQLSSRKTQEDGGEQGRAPSTLGARLLPQLDPATPLEASGLTVGALEQLLSTAASSRITEEVKRQVMPVLQDQANRELLQEVREVTANEAKYPGCRVLNREILAKIQKLPGLKYREAYALAAAEHPDVVRKYAQRKEALAKQNLKVERPSSRPRTTTGNIETIQDAMRAAREQMRRQGLSAE